MPAKVSKKREHDETEMLRQQLAALQLQNAQLAQYQRFYHMQQYTQQQQFAHHQQSNAIVIQNPNAASNTNPDAKYIFLGGYIGMDDWQKNLIERLKADMYSQSSTI